MRRQVGGGPGAGAAAAMQITGWLLIGAGFASGVVGAVFTYKYSDDQNKAEAALDRYNDAPAGEQNPEDKKAYNDAKDRLPGDKAGLIIGYAGAGVFLTTGIVLAAIGARKGREARRRAAVAPTWNGVSVAF